MSDELTEAKEVIADLKRKLEIAIWTIDSVKDGIFEEINSNNYGRKMDAEALTRQFNKCKTSLYDLKLGRVKNGKVRY